MPEIPAKYTWNFTTTPQIGLAGRSLGYTRGHVLGGSSSISELESCSARYILNCTLADGMVYTRGSADDYDRIASLTEDDGWSWDRLQYYIRKVCMRLLLGLVLLTTHWQHERWSSPVNSSLKFFDPNVHGFHGMTAVSLSKTPHSFDDRMLKATEEGNEFSFNTDYNSGKPLGFGKYSSVILSHKRFLITINIRLAASDGYFKRPP